MARRRERLSIAQARRLALAAQGFGQARPAAPGLRDLRRTVRRLGLLQIDSVNVVARAHLLPLFSRLGPYETALLDRAAYAGRRRVLFEYWGHEASLIPIERHPLYRWRMQDAADGRKVYGALTRFARENAGFVDEVLAEVAARGPLSASELALAHRGEGGWWGWGRDKFALEWLFWTGAVTTATRRTAGFERVYGLPEQVLPKAALALPTPPREEAQRQLLRDAIAALGVATGPDLRDYYRLPAEDCGPRIDELVEAGDLLPVAVEGWKGTAYLDPAARIPRRIEATALLAPFDPVVWHRQRAERLFDFHYRIEIYTPQEKRRWGYYVLPALAGDRLIGRFDLKADRASSRLLVQSAHAEEGFSTGEVRARMADELQALAGWLGLERVADRAD